MRYDSLKMRIASPTHARSSVRAEMAAERSVNSAVARTQLRSQLLAQLNSAREQGIRLDAQASTDPTVRGWLELGAMAHRRMACRSAGRLTPRAGARNIQTTRPRSCWRRPFHNRLINADQGAAWRCCCR